MVSSDSFLKQSPLSDFTVFVTGNWVSLQDIPLSVKKMWWSHFTDTYGSIKWENIQIERWWKQLLDVSWVTFVCLFIILPCRRITNIHIFSDFLSDFLVAFFLSKAHNTNYNRKFPYFSPLTVFWDIALLFEEYWTHFFYIIVILRYMSLMICMDPLRYLNSRKTIIIPKCIWYTQNPIQFRPSFKCFESVDLDFYRLFHVLFLWRV